MLGGYNPLAPVDTGRSLSTMQVVGLDGQVRETELEIPGNKAAPYFSRMASAVTLSTKEVLLTGGLFMEREVFLLKDTNLQTWVQQSRMLNGRLCHASVATMVGGEESVLVAGGWTTDGEASSSVELFSVKRNRWKLMQDLPSPRVDFALQVITDDSRSTISF